MLEHDQDPKARAILGEICLKVGTTSQSTPYPTAKMMVHHLMNVTTASKTEPTVMSA